MGVKAEGLQNLISEHELQLKAVYLAAMWLETIFYGIYFCLCVAVISVLIERRAWGLFLEGIPAGNTFMFFFISIHNGQSVYRLITAYAYQIDVHGPVLFVNDLNNWTTYSAPILLALVLWIGDALVIYRCFLVWQRDWRVIALSVVLFFASVGTQAATFWWTWYQSDISSLAVTSWPLLNAAFPLYLAQNTLTTGLIISKIWLQTRQTRAAGLVPLNTPSLVSIMRVIIESAAIYTVGMLVMVVLRALDHFTRAIAHCCLVPVTGITFVLMAMRTHTVREEAKNPPASASLMPNWLLDDR
ncbi:hypothetical protein BKA70DRAFT_1497366 [Coprinopsis sp. MPI-PUGE-AT-0042]|nr:hypothetical protein BKA70DRAFT_1497366 [Coprinopsis sp. MPI-PUGE-AT-0042]